MISGILMTPLWYQCYSVANTIIKRGKSIKLEFPNFLRNKHSHLQSGNALCPWAVDTDVERQLGFTRQVAEEVNCTASMDDAMMECLRLADERDLVRAQSSVSLYNVYTYIVFIQWQTFGDVPGFEASNLAPPSPPPPICELVQSHARL